MSGGERPMERLTGNSTYLIYLYDGQRGGLGQPGPQIHLPSTGPLSIDWLMPASTGEGLGSEIRLLVRVRPSQHTHPQQWEQLS